LLFSSGKIQFEVVDCKITFRLLQVFLRLSRPLLACVIYNPTGVNGFSIYGPALEAQISKYTDVLVPGDLNHHIHSREPTNFHGAPSCIDLFCSNRPECVGMFSQIDVPVPGIPTTYVLIYGSYYIPSVANRDYRDFYRDFKHIDMVALLNEVVWTGLTSTLQLMSMICFIFSILLF
jgi:hypothetical protein